MPEGGLLLGAAAAAATAALAGRGRRRCDRDVRAGGRLATAVAHAEPEKCAERHQDDAGDQANHRAAAAAIAAARMIMRFLAFHRTSPVNGPCQTTLLARCVFLPTEHQRGPKPLANPQARDSFPEP